MKFLRIAASITALLLILVLTTLAHATEKPFFSWPGGHAYLLEWNTDHQTIGRDVFALIEYRPFTSEKFRSQWEISGCISGPKVITTILDGGTRKQTFWSDRGNQNGDLVATVLCTFYRDEVEKRRQNRNPTRLQPMT